MNATAFTIQIYYVSGIICFALFLCFPEAFLKSGLVTHGKTGSNSRFQVPKRLFTIFYAIGVASALLIFEFNVFWEWLLLFHLLRRVLETIIWPYSSHSKMHLIHSMVGISYYIVLTISFSQICETPNFPAMLCVIIFIVPSLWQTMAHRSLYRTRLSESYVPIGDIDPLFSYVLCPHYLAEILIHLFFTIITGFHVLFILNLMFVTSNLAISAWTTKLWYKNRFPNASNRPHVLLPFLNL